MAVEQKTLMPKATAVWLVDNTGLSFEQIADYLRVASAGGEGHCRRRRGQGHQGQDPVATGQLTREQIAEPRRIPRSA